nr:MAG TPA: hypothetical protein [Caudoviricetes sp.]
MANSLSLSIPLLSSLPSLINFLNARSSAKRAILTAAEISLSFWHSICEKPSIASFAKLKGNSHALSKPCSSR